MKKSLIAMAVAGAMLAPAANAATTLYGQVEEAWVDSDSELATNFGTLSRDSQKHRSNTRIGIKGSEDIGGGLSAIFQIETQVKDAGGPRDSGSTWNADRNTFVGLKGSFGTILGGRHDTPEKISTSFLDKFDATGIDPYGTIMTNNLRPNGTLAYISPNFSGFTVGLALVPGEGDYGELDGFPLAVNSGWADAYSVMAKYKNGPISIGLGHTGYEYGLIDAESTRFGIHYGQGNFDIGAVYQQSEGITSVISGTNVEAETWYLTGKFKFSNNYVLIGYGKSEPEVEGLNLGDLAATVYGIEFGHNFSKRTKVYLGYGNTEISDSLSVITKNDLVDRVTINGVERNITNYETGVVSIGLKHKF